MPASPKSPATIACIITVGEEKRDTALQQAIELAAAAHAHLSVTIAAQKMATPYAPMWMSLPSALVADLNKKTQNRAEELADQTRRAIGIAAINCDIDLSVDNIGTTAEGAVRAARSSDVIVVDQPAAPLDMAGTVLEEALFRSGRPVLIASPRKLLKHLPRSAVLAWDGSAVAARAVADAISAFPTIQRVDIVSVTGEKSLEKSVPGADLARHLARKVIETSVTTLGLGGQSVAATLDRHAMAEEADLIIMGGYGHSRLRQFVFGGVTLALTQTASTPLFMSH
jgi:nucleotide-binding universal stress UspA family protein